MLQPYCLSLSILDLKSTYAKHCPHDLKSVQLCISKEKCNSSDPDLFALKSSQCCFEEVICKRPFHQLFEELLTSRGEKNQTVFTKGKQTKAVKKKKKKKPSLFLMPELTRGQGGLRLTGLAHT